MTFSSRKSSATLVVLGASALLGGGLQDGMGLVVRRICLSSQQQVYRYSMNAQEKKRQRKKAAAEEVEKSYRQQSRKDREHDAVMSRKRSEMPLYPQPENDPGASYIPGVARWKESTFQTDCHDTLTAKENAAKENAAKENAAEKNAAKENAAKVKAAAVAWKRAQTHSEQTSKRHQLAPRTGTRSELSETKDLEPEKLEPKTIIDKLEKELESLDRELDDFGRSRANIKSDKEHQCACNPALTDATQKVTDAWNKVVDLEGEVKQKTQHVKEYEALIAENKPTTSKGRTPRVALIQRGLGLLSTHKMFKMFGTAKSEAPPAWQKKLAKLQNILSDAESRLTVAQEEHKQLSELQKLTKNIAIANILIAEVRPEAK